MGNNPIFNYDVLGDVAKPVAGEKSGVNNKKAWNTYIKRVKGKEQVRVLAPNGQYYTFSSKQFSFTYSDGKETGGQIKKEGVWQIKNKNGHFMWDNVSGKFIKNTSGNEPGENGPPGMPKTTTYAGGDNIKGYSQPPQNIADAAGLKHDKQYEYKLGLEGKLGVLSPSSRTANIELAKESQVIMIMYKRGLSDPYTGAKVSSLTYKLAKNMARFETLELIKSPVTFTQFPGEFLNQLNNGLSKVPSFFPNF
jgi:hypothetical protein